MLVYDICKSAFLHVSIHMCVSAQSMIPVSQCIENLHCVYVCLSVAENWACGDWQAEVDGPSKCWVFLVPRDYVWSCFQFAIGRWAAGWRRLQGSREARAHIPSLLIHFFSFLALGLLSYSKTFLLLLLTPPSPPPVPHPLAVSSWLLCVCSHLLLSAALYIIPSFIFICFVTIILSICPVSFSMNLFYRLDSLLL